MSNKFKLNFRFNVLANHFEDDMYFNTFVFPNKLLTLVVKLPYNNLWRIGMLFLQFRRQFFELFAHLHDWVSFWVM